MAAAQDWCSTNAGKPAPQHLNRPRRQVPPERLRDPRDHRDRLLDELAVSHPEHAVSRGEQRLIPLAVAFEGRAVAVGTPAVELEYQPLRRPQDIDEIPLYEHVGDRTGQLRPL